MYVSIFTDEFFEDVYTALPKIAAWGIRHVDFRARIGGKPIEKLTNEELRMGLARELLYGTALSVAEAAAAAGYEDPHYFARLYRRRFGISPGSARRP